MSNIRTAFLILATPLFGLAWNYPDSSTCPDDGSGVCEAVIGPITLPAHSGADYGFITPFLTAEPHCGYYLSISVDQPDLVPPFNYYTAIINGTQSWTSSDPYPLIEDDEVVTSINNDTDNDLDTTVTFTLTYFNPNGYACPPQ